MGKFFLRMNNSNTQIIIFAPHKVVQEIKINGINTGTETKIRFVNTDKNIGLHMALLSTKKLRG